MYRQPVMTRLLASAISIAKRAGDEVRRITKSGVLGVVDKGVQDYQTEADRVAQRMIVASLSKKFPKCTIVGEEDLAEDEESDNKLFVDTEDDSILNRKLPEVYNEIKQEDITIWVDPLDGTTEFVKGFLEHVTVLIGISVGGKSVAGVIHQPFYGYDAARASGQVDPATLPGRTLWGLVELGCFGLETRAMSSDRLIITTTASHGNVDIEESLAGLKPDEVLKVGGAGFKVLMVLEGRAHSYVFPSNGCKRWDTSAPEAILLSAGGQFTTVLGDRIVYEHRADNDYKNYCGIVASTNQEVHSRVLENIPQAVKERLIAAQPSG